MTRTGNWWLAVPAVAYLAVLFVGPVASVLTYSVLQRDFYGGVIWSLSSDAWRMATDGITLRILARTLTMAVGVTGLNLLVAYPCAALLARLPREQRTMWVLVISFPLMTSLLLRTYGWLNILPREWLGTLPAVALVLGCNYLPFMLLPLVKAYERVDATLFAAALDLGATPWQAFWRVTVPITRPGAISGAMLVFIPVTGEYLIPHFIGNGMVSVVGTEVMYHFDHRNWPFAAALATWLAAIILGPIVVSLVRREASADTNPKRERGIA